MRSGNPSSIRRRLGANFAAGIGTQVVLVVQQLGLVPVLLYAWGAEGYGVWLTLWSVMTYFWAIADFGFANVVASELGMRRGTDAAGSLAVFQTVLRVLVVVSAAVLALAWLAPVGQLVSVLRVPAAWEVETARTMSLLISLIPCSLLGSLFCAVYRGDGQMAKGVLYYQILMRGGEIGVMIVIALSKGTPSAMAGAIMFFRLIGTLFLGAAVRKDVAWVRFGFIHGSWSRARAFVLPAASHSAGPISQVIIIAGVNVAVNMALGPATVATVAVLRTMGNVAYQGFGLFINAVWPELSALIAQKQVERAKRLMFILSQWAVWLTAAGCAVLGMAGVPLLRVWTGDRIEMAWGLFLLQLLSILIASIWRVPSTVLLATNRNGRMGVVLVAGALAGLSLTIVLLPFAGTTAVGIGMVAAELVAARWILGDSLKQLRAGTRSYFAALASLPTVAGLRGARRAEPQ